MTDDSTSTVSSPTLTVAIVNDSEVIVRGLEAVLEPDPALRVREVDVGQTDVQARVDVALLDTYSVIAPEDEVRRLLGDEDVDAVVLYTWEVSDDLVRTARSLGVRGVLRKSLTAEELRRALHAVAALHEGDGPLIERGPASAEAEPPGDWPGRREGLTPRQSEVVALIARGLTNEQIAATLCLSMNTVKSYIRMAYRQMGVESRAQAVRWAVDHDIYHGVDDVEQGDVNRRA